MTTSPRSDHGPVPFLSPAHPPAARPRLSPGRLPVPRAPDALQFGTHPERALVLDGLTPPLHRMITALDGTRPVAEVIADAVACGVAPGPAAAVLSRMTTAGLLGLRPPGPSPGRVPRSVLVRGGGRLAVALARVLVGAGVDEVGVVSRGRVGADDTGTGLTAADIGRPTAEAVAGAIPGVRTTACPAPDLVVLADGAGTEPAVADALVARRRPHLAVAVRDGVGLVGPLVLPGRWPCVRCVDLARADADPAWPTVLAHLTGSPPPTTVAAASVTAALAAAQVLTALAAATSSDAPARPSSLGGVLELDADQGSLRRVAVSAHPSCPCGAPVTADTAEPCEPFGRVEPMSRPRRVPDAPVGPVVSPESVMVARVA